MGTQIQRQSTNKSIEQGIKKQVTPYKLDDTYNNENQYMKNRKSSQLLRKSSSSNYSEKSRVKKYSNFRNQQSRLLTQSSFKKQEIQSAEQMIKQLVKQSISPYTLVETPFIQQSQSKTYIGFSKSNNSKKQLKNINMDLQQFDLQNQQHVVSPKNIDNQQQQHINLKLNDYYDYQDENRQNGKSNDNQRKFKSVYILQNNEQTLNQQEYQADFQNQQRRSSIFSPKNKKFPAIKTLQDLEKIKNLSAINITINSKDQVSNQINNKFVIAQKYMIQGQKRQSDINFDKQNKTFMKKKPSFQAKQINLQISQQQDKNNLYQLQNIMKLPNKNTIIPFKEESKFQNQSFIQKGKEIIKSDNFLNQTDIFKNCILSSQRSSRSKKTRITHQGNISKNYGEKISIKSYKRSFANALGLPSLENQIYDNQKSQSNNYSQFIDKNILQDQKSQKDPNNNVTENNQNIKLSERLQKNGFNITQQNIIIIDRSMMNFNQRQNSYENNIDNMLQYLQNPKDTKIIKQTRNYNLNQNLYKNFNSKSSESQERIQKMKNKNPSNEKKNLAPYLTNDSIEIFDRIKLSSQKKVKRNSSKNFEPLSIENHFSMNNTIQQFIDNKNLKLNQKQFEKQQFSNNQAYLANNTVEQSFYTRKRKSKYKKEADNDFKSSRQSSQYLNLDDKQIDMLVQLNDSKNLNQVQIKKTFSYIQNQNQSKEQSQKQDYRPKSLAISDQHKNVNISLQMQKITNQTLKNTENTSILKQNRRSILNTNSETKKMQSKQQNISSTNLNLKQVLQNGQKQQIIQQQKLQYFSHFAKNTIQNFNDAVSTINMLIQATIRAKNQSSMQPNTFQGLSATETFLKIQKMARQCGFPQEFTRKNQQEMNSFIKTKDYLTIIKVKMHQLINFVVYHQFIFKSNQCTDQIQKDSDQLDKQIIKEKIGKPKIFKYFEEKFNSQQEIKYSNIQNVIPNQLNFNQPQYKFYTDQSGNNHAIVRQILKKRPWLSRIDSLKSPEQFDQIHFFWTQWKKGNIVQKLTESQIYGKIEGNVHLTNKANLLATMTSFYKNLNENNDPFMYLPVTYSIKSGKQLEKDIEFIELYGKYSNQNNKFYKDKNTWICKPGENANRGRGIVVLPNVDQVKKFLQSQNHGEKWVVQKYLSNPLLIGGKFWYNSPMRKFDIRVFGLVQIIDGIHCRGYFYKEGYIRTSSYEFDISDLSNRDIHLTNDAVQGENEEYGKYEQGNKISFKDFAVYLQNHKGVDFYENVLTKIKQAIQHTHQAFWMKIKEVQQTKYNKEKIINQFELFGYDFMIDDNLNVYLIEVNTNPCLDTSPCQLLQRVITQVLDQTFKIAVDPFLRANEQQYSQAQEMSISEINYEMIFSNHLQVQNSSKAYASEPNQKTKNEEENMQQQFNEILELKKKVLLNQKEQIQDFQNYIMRPEIPKITSLDDHGIDLQKNSVDQYGIIDIYQLSKRYSKQD